MSRTISLEELAKEAWGGLDSLANIGTIFDTASVGYRWKESVVEAIITTGVMGELWKHIDKFPHETIRDFAYMFDPEVVEEMTSLEDEVLIKKATLKYAKNFVDINGMKARRKNGSIGWVDTQQISHAMERAREGYKTLIISDDWDIMGTVIALSQELDYVKNNVWVLSVKKYLERVHKDRLSGLEKQYKNEMVREIISQYRSVA